MTEAMGRPGADTVACNPPAVRVAAGFVFAAILNVILSQDDIFVCRDVALDDEAAVNLALQC